MRLEKLSLGMGDRFEHQVEAQLRAVLMAKKIGIDLTPVWNKSNREHSIVKSEPSSLRREVDRAAASLGWTSPYRVDADHINYETVDRFIEASDFYTIDVADYIGRETSRGEIVKFCAEARRYIGSAFIPGLVEAVVLDSTVIEKAAEKFLGAIREAGRIARKIESLKGRDFIMEVSIDETDVPQTSAELLLILLMLAGEKVACQTIAPKFVGRFNKGVDYIGDLARFEKEFEAAICVVQFAIREFGLPPTLKLSVHSGSDKFSLYPIINRQLKKHSVGVHVKTAGTTWLEEVIGLAQSGAEGLGLAQEIYGKAYLRFDELVSPYAAVVDIDPGRLPSPAEVKNWSPDRFCAALRHNQAVPGYNDAFRQFLHVSFKVAAEIGARYCAALIRHRSIIARGVTENLFDRHIVPLFREAT
jgi:hypothetical protein